MSYKNRKKNIKQLLVIRIFFFNFRNNKLYYGVESKFRNLLNASNSCMTRVISVVAVISGIEVEDDGVEVDDDDVEIDDDDGDGDGWGEIAVVDLDTGLVYDDVPENENKCRTIVVIFSAIDCLLVSKLSKLVTTVDRGSYANFFSIVFFADLKLGPRLILTSLMTSIDEFTGSVVANALFDPILGWISDVSDSAGDSGLDDETEIKKTFIILKS